MFSPTLPPPPPPPHAQQVTWSLDPTSASTSETFVGSANEDLSAYANKSALLAIAASTALTLTGSDGSTVVANPAVVDVMDGPNPPVLAFGKEGVSANTYGILSLYILLFRYCHCACVRYSCC